MAAPIRAFSVQRPLVAKVAALSRSLHCSAVNQAGGPWRVKNGLPVNPSLFGPLIDLPDWSFADGQPAPPQKNRVRRMEKNKELAHRIVMISKEIDLGIDKWQAKQREKEEEKEKKRSNRLQPKGGFVPPTSK